MIVLVCGSRTYGTLDAGTPDERPDPAAQSLLYSVLTGLWSEGTVGYLTVDMEGFTLVEGGCPTGADQLARRWAHSSPFHGYGQSADEPPFKHKHFNARWDIFGNHAGPIRNQEMIDYVSKSDHATKLVVGFIDKPLNKSRGTFDCITRAEEAKLPTYTVRAF